MLDPEMANLLLQVITNDLVGASDKPERSSYGTMAYLLAQR